MTAIRWASGAVLMVLAASMAGTDEAGSVKKTEEILKRAGQALDKQHYDEAIALLNEALKIEAKNPSAYALRGIAHKRKGERDDALADYEQALKLDAKNVLAYASRGALYMESGDLDKALADFSTAIEIEPKYAIAYLSRGSAYNIKHEYAKALADFTKVIELDPKSIAAFVNRGQTHLYNRQLDKALADFDKALQIEPKLIVGYIGRGVVFQEKGDLDKAFEEFGKALAIDPKSVEAYQARGDAWMEKEEHEKAIADYSHVLKLNPKEVRARVSRAEAYTEKGDYEKGIADFQKALKLYANNPEALAGLAWIWATCPQAELRDGKKAVEYAEKACKLTEFRDATFLDTLAAAYAENGQFDEAVKMQKEALKSPEDFPKKELAKAKSRLQLYMQGKPYRKSGTEAGKRPSRSSYFSVLTKAPRLASFLRHRRAYRIQLVQQLAVAGSFAKGGDFKLSPQYPERLLGDRCPRQ